jgi:hypothetical protein
VPVAVQITLDRQSLPAGETTDAVGTSSTRPATRFALPVAFAPAATGQSLPLTLGLALVNPSDTATAILLQLLDSEGTVRAEGQSLSLGPHGQTAVVVPDLPAFKTFLSLQPEFTGTLLVIADQPVAALGVGRDFGSAFAVPAFPLANPSP